MSSIFNQSIRVIDVLVHIQSIKARNSNKNGIIMNLKIESKYVY